MMLSRIQMAFAVATIAGGFGCSNNPGLNEMTAPVLGSDFAQCFASVAANTDTSQAVACFYLDGASRVVQSSVASACEGGQCDLKTWQLGASGPIEPLPNGKLPFPNANEVLADEASLDLQAEVVWLTSGDCPARPPFDPFAPSFEQECDGGGRADDQQCFASLSVPLRPSAAGLEVRSEGSRFRFSNRYRAEIEQAAIDFETVCTTAGTREAIGAEPTTRSIQLILSGSGQGEVTVPGFAPCTKPAGATEVCSIDVLEDSTITLMASLVGETTLDWPAICTTSTETSCTVSVGPGTEPLPLQIAMDLVRYDLTINVASAPQPVAARVTADQSDSDGAPVDCSLPASQSTTTCTVPIDAGTIMVLTANDGDDFVLQNWGGQCDEETDVSCTVVMSSHRTVSANFEFGRFPLTLLAPEGSNTPAGGGRITDLTGTIDCGTASPTTPKDCFDAVSTGDDVTLTADAPASQIEKRVLVWDIVGDVTPVEDTCRDMEDTELDEFGRLTGDNQCRFTVTEGRINLTPEFGFLTTIDVIGEGSVTSEQADISECGVATAPCESYFPFGKNYSITATPDAAVGARFIRWTRNDLEVSSQQALVHSATSAASFTAVFGHQLTVDVPGDGTCGSVQGAGIPNDPVIDCDSTCSAAFTHDSTVELTANAAAGAAFDGWSEGGCASDEDCSLVMNRTRSVEAAFVFPLSVSIDAPAGEDGAVTGTGGRITGPGIDCAPSCSTTVECDEPADSITLTAEASPGYRSGTWTGCSASSGPTCQVEMDTQRSVSHRFECFRTVDVSIAGGGTLAGGCTEPTCSVEALCNGSLLLSAVAANAATPQEPVWSNVAGCDVGALSCPVEIEGRNRSVDLTFTYPIVVTAKPANGSLVGPESLAGSMNCSTTASDAECRANYLDNVAVDLEAVPDAGYRFVRWTGCTQAGGTEVVSGTRNFCRLPMTAPVTGVTAIFRRVYVLTIDMEGAPGTVTVATPALGVCTYPDTCQYTVDENTQVTMDRSEAQGSVFVGWEGGNSNCTGTNNCTVVMDRNVTTVATFHWPVEARFDVSQLAGGLGDAVGARIRSTTPSCEIDVAIGSGGAPSGDRTCSVATGTTIDFEVTPPVGGVVNYDFATLLQTGQQVTGANPSIEIDRATTAEFRFSRSYSLEVQISGRGDITDGATVCAHLDDGCRFRVPQQDPVIVLTAVPNPDGRGWSISWPSGTCSSISGNQCTVVLSADRTISANFTYPVSFSQDIVGDVIQARGCEGCHCTDPDCLAFATGLNFEGIGARTAWEQLVCDEDCDTADCCSALTERADDDEVGCDDGPSMGPFRINLVNPVQSQFLQMPGRNPLPPQVDWCTNHGGTLFDNTTTDYQSILDWISGGAPFN